MVALSWGETGTRFFETGIDRGVLYVDGKAVAWSGITAIKESSTGGDATPYYSEGLKYMNISQREEFEATLEAFSAPKEFDQCVGIMRINGLSISQQNKSSFALSYRTLVGNDLEGIAHGYKIHIIYGAIATPSDADYQSLNDSPEPVKYSWAISTVPEKLDGFLPSAHYVIDSRIIPADLLSDIEEILYGTATSNPWIPPAADFQNVIDGSVLLEITAVHDDGPNTTELMRAHQSPLPPTVIPTGSKVIWLDTSSGDYATLKLVTGD